MNKIVTILVAAMFSLVSATYSQTSLTISPTTITGNTGETVTASLIVNDFTDIVSMQYGIKWDPTVIQFDAVENFNLTDLTASSFNTNSSPSGTITVAWFDNTTEGISVADGEAIYTMSFTVLGDASSGSSIVFDGSATPIEIANAIYNFGYLMRYAGKRDSSILFLTKSLREYKRLKDTGKMAYVYTQLGANSVKSGNSSKPIDYFDSAVNCFKIAKDTVPLIKAIGILGSLQSSVGQSESALKNGIEALNLAKLINDSNSIGQELQKVAGMHYRTGNTVIAKEMYYEAIKVNNKTKNIDEYSKIPF